MHKATVLIIEGTIVALVVAYLVVEGVQENVAVTLVLLAIAIPSAVLLFMTLFDKER